MLDSNIILNYQVLVYPGMQAMLNNKDYIIQHAILLLDKEEVTVVVKRASIE